MGEVTYTHNLLNADGEIVAHCLDFENAYMIYDINGDVVEYCEDSESPLEGIRENVYYTGPFNYYTESEDTYTNVLTGDNITFDVLSDESDAMEISINVDESQISESDNEIQSEFAGNLGGSCSTNSLKVTTTQDGEYKKVKQALTDKPRCFNYYEDGYCGAVAATTLLFYYHDYINSGVLKSNYVNNPYSLYTYLKNYITYYASYDVLRSGIARTFSIVSNNTYSVQIVDGLMDTNEHLVDTWKKYETVLKANECPAILLLQSHPSYGDHWVVTYGVIKYYYSNGKVKSHQYVVNNGFAKNDVKIGCKYADGFVFFN